MDENTKSLIKQQAWESAPKMHISCLLYAIFYTFCLYQNRSGITFPFYVGGTLFFFGFYLKKSGVTAVKDNRFWTVALILLGVINCTTDSYVLIGLNRLLGIVLFAVWMLQMLLGQMAHGNLVQRDMESILGKPVQNISAFYRGNCL